MKINFPIFSRFPSSDMVEFRALVTPCMPTCEPVQCDVLDYTGQTGNHFQVIQGTTRWVTFRVIQGRGGWGLGAYAPMRKLHFCDFQDIFRLGANS